MIVGRFFDAATLSQPVQVASEKEHIRIQTFGPNQVFLGGPGVSQFAGYSLPTGPALEMTLERGDSLWAVVEPGGSASLRLLVQS